MSIADSALQLKKDFDDVYEAGKQAEKSDWWDTFQYFGTRIRYDGAFFAMPADLFYPKHDMVTSNSVEDMFKKFGTRNSQAPDGGIDLSKRLEDCGVVLNTAKSNSFNRMFHYACVNRVPTINMSSCTGTVSGMFYECRQLETIDKLILENTGVTAFSDVFGQCVGLKNLTIEGVIGKNGIDLRYSTLLTKASITSVVNALSTTTSGLSVTFSKTAVDNAFEGGSTGSEWLALKATRSNWDIKLV